MSIVVCVPWLKPHPKFLTHFTEWYAGNKEKHDLRLHWEFYKALHKVQGDAVKKARKLGASHILFTEDDQWGFPLDGIEVLLESDKDVIGFPTTFKSAPYVPMCCNKLDPTQSLITDSKNLAPVYQAGGDVIQPVDLLTWAFTLVKMSVFDRLRKNPFECWGSVPTDSYFNEYCDDVGIKRYAHFGFWIEHGEIPRKLHPFYRAMNDSIISAQNRFGTDAFTADATVETYDAQRCADHMKLIEQDALNVESMADEQEAA